jgi:hypothetical protein
MERFGMTGGRLHALAWLLMGMILILGGEGCGKRYRPTSGTDEPPPDEPIGRAGEDLGTTPFTYGEDQAGKLLTELLPPLEKSSFYLADAPASSMPFPESVNVQLPATELLSLNSEMPPVTLKGSLGRVWPMLLPEEPPLARSFGYPVTLGEPELPIAKLVRLSGPDLEEPPSLPLLSQSQSQRAPLDDPGAGIAATVALQPPIGRIPAASVSPTPRFLEPSRMGRIPDGLDENHLPLFPIKPSGR